MNITTVQTSLPNQGIDCIWHAQAAHLEQKATSLPFLQHELIINLGEKFEVSGARENEKVIFSPISSQAFQTTAGGRYETLGLMFTPIGIYYNFGFSVPEFAQVDRLDDFFFGRDLAILDRLADTSSQTSKLHLIRDIFTTYSVRKPTPIQVIQYFQALQAKGPSQIQRLARDIAVSSKHLRSSFKDVVGISPKRHLQLLQLRQVLTSLATRMDLNLTEVALRHGFYDQSHFIRKFKQFSGLTPSVYRQQMQQQTHHFYHTLLQ